MPLKTHLRPAKKPTPGAGLADRKSADRKSHARSRVSNGKDLLPGIDGRSIVARRYRDIASAMLVVQCRKAMASAELRDGLAVVEKRGKASAGANCIDLDQSALNK